MNDISDMLLALSQYPNGTYIKLVWPHEGLVLGGIIETIYETDNGKREGTSMYREFYACAFRVKKTIQNTGSLSYPYNAILEISPDTAPMMISLEDDTIIWSK
ncbi:MAG: hypothetical protein E7292_05345 [Lachnospiraceae bacterium]|nr:hypothetical protein [Lachnospiraceae bacterium]